MKGMRVWAVCVSSLVPVSPLRGSLSTHFKALISVNFREAEKSTKKKRVAELTYRNSMLCGFLTLSGFSLIKQISLISQISLFLFAVRSVFLWYLGS